MNGGNILFIFFFNFTHYQTLNSRTSISRLSHWRLIRNEKNVRKFLDFKFLTIKQNFNWWFHFTIHNHHQPIQPFLLLSFPLHLFFSASHIIEQEKKNINKTLFEFMTISSLLVEAFKSVRKRWERQRRGGFMADDNRRERISNCSKLCLFWWPSSLSRLPCVCTRENLSYATLVAVPWTVNLLMRFV